MSDDRSGRAIAAADPVVLADAGFSYEILPMMQAALGKRVRPDV